MNDYFKEALLAFAAAQPLNLSVFRAMAAGFNPPPLALDFASNIASGSSWACLVLLGWQFIRHASRRVPLLLALLAGGLATLLAQELSEMVDSPRPFMLGLSPPYLDHSHRGGLPSKHAAVMFTVAFMLWLQQGLRRIGWLVAAAAVATAWARIYVGVHFPMDILAGVLLAACIVSVYALASAPLSSAGRPS